MDRDLTATRSDENPAAADEANKRPAGAGGDDRHDLAAPPPANEPRKDRVLIPALLPLLAMIAVALYTLNVSRVFLAGDSTSALVIAAGITVSILAAGAIISASPRLRTSSLVMFMALVIVIVVSAGLLSLGPSLNEGGRANGGPLAQPTAAAASTVKVTAGPGLTFNGVAFKGNYTAESGVVEIDYGGDPGHTLQFRTQDYQGFPLHSTGSPTRGKVALKSGTYQIYCTVPGHAAAGMEATITVT
jgi:plastocyanin